MAQLRCCTQWPISISARRHKAPFRGLFAAVAVLDGCAALLAMFGRGGGLPRSFVRRQGRFSNGSVSGKWWLRSGQSMALGALGALG